MKNLNLDNFLPYHLVVSSDKLSGVLSKVYTVYELTIPEWRILVQLSYWSKLTHSNLCKATNMEKARVSRGLILMDKKGLVERQTDDHDKRVTHLQLSPAGNALYEKIEPEVLDWNSRLVSKIGEDDYQTLLRILKKTSEIAHSI